MNRISLKILLVLALWLPGYHSIAVVTIEIDQGVVRGIPIAIVPFGVSQDIGEELVLEETVRNDLTRSGRFDVINPNDYIAAPTQHTDVNFADWQLIESDYLVIGSIEAEGDKYRIEARLFDVFEQKQIFGSQYLSDANSIRYTMHLIANAVYETITGSKSSFDTRIAYTVASMNENNSVEHQLVVSDYDGHNPKVLLISKDPILSPTWSPDSSQIAYSILGPHQTKIWIQDIMSGDRRGVATELVGHNRSPNWSPDGMKIAFANSSAANSEIFVHVIQTGETIRLTNDQSIDTEPAWSPDSDHVVFTSNRGRKAQIYRVNVRPNQTAKRVTHDGETNSGASYSPSGDRLILITDQGKGSQVGIYDFDSNSITVVSSTSIDDSAVFSPHADMLMYVVEGQDRHVRILSPDGRVQSRVSTIEGAVKQVAWGGKS